VHLRAAPHGQPRATLVLGHGAGGGVQAQDLVAIADALPADGIEVALVEQPWRVAGRRVAGAPATLDAAWVAVLADLRSRGIGRRRLVVGGRSAGARVACRTVGTVGPDALLLLAFPVRALRPPVGRPAETRLPELLDAARLVPTVVVQGERDRMGAPDEVAVALSEAAVTARVVPIPAADHAFRVPARAPLSQADALDVVVRAARATALRIISGQY
jgi:predicted alpha/beta-hydrolase family hydrolase